MTEQEFEKTEEAFLKTTISIEELQEKLAQHNEYLTLKSIFTQDESRGPDNYIKEMDTSNIVQFSDGNISTYTMKVLTQEDNSSSYTNLVIKEENDELYEFLVQYTPSEGYIQDKLSSTEYVPFDGSMALMQTDGTIIDQKDVTNGTTERAATTECTFSVTTIWNCAADNGHETCVAGGNYIEGVIIDISCPSSTGTGGGGSGNGTGGSTSGGGGGNGGSSNGNGDLPTDPQEWDLFMNLHNLLGEDDDFYLDNTITTNPDLIFNTFQEFENYYNGFVTNGSQPVQNQDGTYDTMWTISNTIGPTIQFIFNSTLCNNSTGQHYQLNSISMFLQGTNLLGFSAEMDYWNYYFNNDGNPVIDLYFTTGWNPKVGGIEFHVENSKHYQIVLNQFTGGLINDTEID